TIQKGGGFFFDLLHCDRDGRARNVAHRDMGDTHLGFIKGLSTPCAVSRSALDKAIRETFEGPVLAGEEYHAAVENSLEPCPCGGRYRYDAPSRCPSCGSTQDAWAGDPTLGRVFYD